MSVLWGMLEMKDRKIITAKEVSKIRNPHLEAALNARMELLFRPLIEKTSEILCNLDITNKKP